MGPGRRPEAPEVPCHEAVEGAALPAEVEEEVVRQAAAVDTSSLSLHPWV